MARATASPRGWAQAKRPAEAATPLVPEQHRERHPHGPVPRDVVEVPGADAHAALPPLDVLRAGVCRGQNKKKADQGSENPHSLCLSSNVRIEFNQSGDDTTVDTGM